MHCNFHILTDKLIKINCNTQKIILLFFFILFAKSLAAQSYRDIKTPVSIRFNEVNASVLFKELDKQTGYKFNFDDVLQGVILKNISYNRAPLGKILSDITHAGLSFSLVNRSISVNYVKPDPVRRVQPGKIGGKIVDEKGEGMPGASIKILEQNQGIQSSVDGSYVLNAVPGTYTLEISYISYQTKRITGVGVKEGQLTSLDVEMRPAAGALKEVVVTGNYKKESVAGLYAQQKNSASVTDGISAEQIAKTPDNNVASVLKRVNGITMLDNKYVVVRGLTERYNQAMIDGLTVPNTDMNRRNFSFDLIPTELVSSVVVNKTATPDVPSEFVGGQVIVNTLAIPEQNFMTLNVGAAYNSQSTGKDFLSAGGRGNKDFFGFDDGRRKMPDNLVSWTPTQGQDDPRVEGTTVGGYKTGYAGAIEQSKRFNSESFRLYNYKASPNQNYRFTIGRVYDLKGQQGLRIGFTGGLTYRNTQQINTFETVRDWEVLHDYIDKPDTAGKGKAYVFNSNFGVVLNGGIQGERFKVNLRNLYTQTFNEDFYQTTVFNRDLGLKAQNNFVDPMYSRIQQHKIDGENSIGKKGMKLNWSGAFTRMNQDHRDTRKFNYAALSNTFGTFYQRPNVVTAADVPGNYMWDYRLWTAIKERDYNWSVSLSQPFNFLQDKSLVKVGYTGWYKKRSQDITMAQVFAQRNPNHNFTDPYETLLTPDRVGYGLNKAYYFLDNTNGGLFNADSKYHAAYLMLDQRFFQKLRVVYGLRAENFNLKNRQEDEIRRRMIEQMKRPGQTFISDVPILTGEKNWNFLPSVNLTYSFNSKMNLRAAYTKTMIRPDFRETSTFTFPDPLLEAGIKGGNLSSTKIQNVDLRYEFYPNPDEIFSVSGFYKYIDRPVELINENPGTNTVILEYKNQHSAKNMGLEIEWRKSLGFINPALQNFNLFGNAAWIWSEVKTLIKISNPNYDPKNPGKEPKEITAIQPLKRPLIGQSPYIINAGLSYQSRFAGATLSFNRSGYRSYLIAVNPANTEFQSPRSLMDLQLSARVLKQKGEIKFNVSNLLNTQDVYYNNANSWKSEAQSYERIKGTDKYEPEFGDNIRYRMKYGRTYNLSFTYNF